MDEIEFTGNSITLKEAVTILGEKRVEEKTIDYENRDGYELSLNTGGFVSLEDLIEIQYGDDGGIRSLHLTLNEVPSIESDIRALSHDEESDDPPDVPRVDMEDISVEARQNFYQRLRDQPESQPGIIRRIIYSEEQLTRRELDQLIEEAGYESSGGGVSQSLVVLEEVTEEIERHGRGEDQQIEWTGED